MSYFLAGLACVLAVPVIIFCTEILAAFILPVRERDFHTEHEPREQVAILIPAHNESTGLRLTIANIKQHLRPCDRLLVVADNCVDDTAAVAAAASAEVVVRNDPTELGKSYALDFGLRHLSLNPPAIVILIDADCRISEDSIDRLAAACAMTKRPVQALYLMTAPDNSHINYRVAEFAWRVKNWVRPLGLRALNMPCQLMGSGMAFPWELICSANLANGSIVEDLKLGLDLAQLKSPPLFCPSARVTSYFPLSAEGEKSQRKRWEEGHIRLILTAVPDLISKAIAQNNLGLLTLTLDLLVPPLSLLVILVGGMFLATALATLCGISPTALFISGANVAALAAIVFLSWLKYGRDVLPSNAIVLILPYLISKLPLYRKLLSASPTTQWTRTDRGDSSDVSVPGAARVAGPIQVPPSVKQPVDS